MRGGSSESGDHEAAPAHRASRQGSSSRGVLCLCTPPLRTVPKKLRTVRNFFCTVAWRPRLGRPRRHDRRVDDEDNGLDWRGSKSGPRYAPRDFAQPPWFFGTDLRAVFPRWDNPSKDVLGTASEIQHRFVLVVRAELRRRNKPIKRLAAATGLDYHRLTRMLNGQIPMRLADVAVISESLRLDLPWDPDLQHPDPSDGQSPDTTTS